MANQTLHKLVPKLVEASNSHYYCTHLLDQALPAPQPRFLYFTLMPHPSLQTIREVFQTIGLLHLQIRRYSGPRCKEARTYSLLYLRFIRLRRHSQQEKEAAQHHQTHQLYLSQ